MVHTWAPQGETPVLSEVFGRDHLSAIGAMTSEGALYFHAQEKPLDGADVVHFLCHLLRHIPGKLLILWDGSTIHYNEVVRRLLNSDRDGDLWLEPFPPYAPELNPDEGIWNYLKNVELRNLCCGTMDELRHQVHLAVKRLRQKKQVIKACFRQARLKL